MWLRVNEAPETGTGSWGREGWFSCCPSKHTLTPDPVIEIENGEGMATRLDAEFNLLLTIKNAHWLRCVSLLWHVESPSHNVEYIMRQAKTGTPAEALYQRMGMENMGQVMRVQSKLWAALLRYGAI